MNTNEVTKMAKQIKVGGEVKFLVVGTGRVAETGVSYKWDVMNERRSGFKTVTKTDGVRIIDVIYWGEDGPALQDDVVLPASMVEAA